MPGFQVDFALQQPEPEAASVEPRRASGELQCGVTLLQSSRRASVSRRVTVTALRNIRQKAAVTAPTAVQVSESHIGFHMSLRFEPSPTAMLCNGEALQLGLTSGQWRRAGLGTCCTEDSETAN
eukprot:811745-Rhodomonas_salina.2